MLGKYELRYSPLWESWVLLSPVLIIHDFAGIPIESRDGSFHDTFDEGLAKLRERLTADWEQLYWATTAPEPEVTR